MPSAPAATPVRVASSVISAPSAPRPALSASGSPPSPSYRGTLQASRITCAAWLHPHGRRCRLEETGSAGPPPVQLLVEGWPRQEVEVLAAVSLEWERCRCKDEPLRLLACFVGKRLGLGVMGCDRADCPLREV